MAIDNKAKQIQGFVDKSTLDSAQLAQITTEAITSSTSSAIANEQNINTQAFVSNSLVSESMGFVGTSQYSTPDIGFQSSLDSLISTATSNEVQAMSSILDAKMANTEMMLNTGIEVSNMYLDKVEFSAEYALKQEQLQLSKDQFGLQQDEFTWDKYMDTENLDLQQQKLDEQIKQDEWQRSFSERQQAHTEYMDEQQLALEQAQLDAKRAEKQKQQEMATDYGAGIKVFDEAMKNPNSKLNAYLNGGNDTTEIQAVKITPSIDESVSNYQTDFYQNVDGSVFYMEGDKKSNNFDTLSEAENSYTAHQKEAKPHGGGGGMSLHAPSMKYNI